MKQEHRYETCRCCGMEWNVSRKMRMPKRGYVCPRCRDAMRQKGVR